MSASNNRRFHCSLYYGYGNKEKIEDKVSAPTPQEAAQEFMYRHFPDGNLYTPGREEKAFIAWSFGVSCSGQRLWVYED